MSAGDARAADLAGARLGERQVRFADAWRTTPVYDRQKLPLSTTFEGPAIVQQLDATTVIEPGDQVEVDRLGNLVIRVGA